MAPKRKSVLDRTSEDVKIHAGERKKRQCRGNNILSTEEVPRRTRSRSTKKPEHFVIDYSVEKHSKISSVLRKSKRKVGDKSNLTGENNGSILKEEGDKEDQKPGNGQKSKNGIGTKLERNFNSVHTKHITDVRQTGNNGNLNHSGFDIEYMDSSSSGSDSEIETEKSQVSSAATDLKINAHTSCTEDKSQKKISTEYIEIGKRPVSVVSVVDSNVCVVSEDEFEKSQIVFSGRKRKAKIRKKTDEKKFKKEEKKTNSEEKSVVLSNKRKKTLQRSEDKKRNAEKKNNLPVSSVKEILPVSGNKERKALPWKHLDDSDVAAVLMLMEGQSKGDNSEAGPSGLGSPSGGEKLSDSETDGEMESSEDEDKDWEDVQGSQYLGKKSESFDL